MAASSLSHILDPAQPMSGPALASTTTLPYHRPDAALQPVPRLPPAPAPASTIMSAPAPAPLPPAHNDTPSASASTPSKSSHTSGNLFACRDCGRSYSRPEHLVRHVQTHTLGRRFICDICQKSFARKDLLRRHVANHDNDSPKKRRRTASSPGAGRVSHACRACAVARVKCDDSKPCQRCVSRKLTCVSSEAGSAAAMHLVHLSANAHSSAHHHNPASSSGASPDSSSPSSYNSPRSQLGTAQRASSATDHSTVLPSTSSVKPEERQLPTPDTVMEQGHQDNFVPSYDSAPSAADMNRLPFSDFLRDVLYEQQQPIEAARQQETQGLEVLNFCDNANLDMTDMDFSLLDHWNLDGIPGAVMPIQEMAARADNAAEISQMRQSLVHVWTQSPWRWEPKSNDSGYREQGNLPVPVVDTSSAQFEESRKKLERVVKDKLEQSARDKVLAIVLSTCRQNSTANRVAASFPSVDVMDTLAHIFLASHTCQAAGWIHFPTFKMNEQWPEWLAMAAAAGAALTPVPTLRKFGYALQEAVRMTIPSRFEDSNVSIRIIGLVQALILTQDVALWSGNRRKMEIAECHLAIPVTMMRYRGKFQRSSYPMLIVEPLDEGAVLEQKWRQWVEREQWKRLIFHCYLRDAQTSMTTLTNPAMSYAELTLPLPEAKELWFARTATEWKALYLQKQAGQAKRAPALGDLFHDVNLLPANHQRLDMQLSISIFLHGFWSLILEYRRLSAVHRLRSYANSLRGNPNLLLSSRHQELVKDLQSFQLIASEWPNVSAQEHLLLNLLMMNLHVSLDDLQLFAGKEGEEQARRVYPILQQWAAGAEARSAVWCAGQILRYAKIFPTGHLKEFYAVAVHHASLALWTYGVVGRASRQQTFPTQFTYEPVYLDGTDLNSIQRFIGYAQGRPVIRGPMSRDRDGVAEASVEDPRACMETCQDILQSNFSHGQESAPAIVENLCQLIKQLGNAAWAVGLG